MDKGSAANKYQKLGQDVKANLLAKFRAQNLDVSKSYPRAKILAILDAAAKAKVEREAMEMIFEQCDSRSLGDVTPQQFVEAYAKGAVLCMERIDSLKQELSQKRKQVHDLNSKSNDVLEKDRLKPRGS